MGSNKMSVQQFRSLKKPRKNEEHEIQVAFIEWFDMEYPKIKKLLFAIPNGAYLNGNQKQRAIQGKKLKREGMRPGVADLFLSIPSGDLCGLYIETKTKTNNQQPSQKEFETLVTSNGYGYCIARSISEFQVIIKSYLAKGEY